MEASLGYIVRSSFETAVAATAATIPSLMGRGQTDDRQGNLRATLLLVHGDLYYSMGDYGLGRKCSREQSLHLPGKVSWPH